MTHTQLDVDVPLNVALRVALNLNVKRWIQPRWLVIQFKAAAGVSVREDLIYAEIFWRKSSAEKAQNERNAGIASFGNRTFGTKRWALLAPIPHGKR